MFNQKTDLQQGIEAVVVQLGKTEKALRQETDLKIIYERRAQRAEMERDALIEAMRRLLDEETAQKIRSEARGSVRTSLRRINRGF